MKSKQCITGNRKVYIVIAITIAILSVFLFSMWCVAVCDQYKRNAVVLRYIDDHSDT